MIAPSDSGWLVNPTFHPTADSLLAGVHYDVVTWNTEGPAIATTTLPSALPINPVMSPSGRYLAIPVWNGTAIKSLADSTSIDFVLATATWPTALTLFSADDRYLLVGNPSGTASLWDLSSRTSVELGETDLGPLGYAAFVKSSGEIVLAAENDNRVQVWTADGSSHRIIDFGTGNVVQANGLVQSHDWLAGTAGGNLFVASLTSSVIVQPIGFTGVASSIAVSPAAGALVVGNDTGAIFKWTLGQPNFSYTVSAHDGRVSSVAIDPTGHEFVTAGYDGMVKRWRVADGVLQRAERAGPEEGYNFGYHVTFIRGGTMLAGGSGLGTVRVWTKELDSLHAILADDYQVSLVGYSETADALVTMNSRDVINVWPFGISLLRSQLCASLVDYFATNVPGRVETGGDLCSAP